MMPLASEIRKELTFEKNETRFRKYRNTELTSDIK